MTALLEKAFNKASRLPEAVQEQLARQLLEDIAGEPKWDKSLETRKTFWFHCSRRDSIAEMAVDAVPRL